MGASYVANSVDTFGFAYTLGAEIYPMKPLSLHFSWKQSFINSNDVSTFKGQFKYHIKNYALFTGYHVNQLGNQQISGAVVGLEYTF